MLLDAKDKFLLRSAYAKGAQGLYEGYLTSKEDSKTDLSIQYLKAFVQFPVSECIRIIRSHENTHLTTQYWGSEYIHLISLVAAYHLDQNEITEGVVWADKAIRLVDYFAPTLNREIRKEVLYDLPASSMVCAYPKQYLQAPCDSFFLDWEIDDIYDLEYHQNDN